MKLWQITILVSLLFISQVLAMSTAPHLPGIMELRNKITAELNQMDSDLAQAARQLAATGLQGADAAKILQKLYDDHSAAVVASTIDPQGELLLVQPGRYQGSKGQSISAQAHFPAMIKTKQPILSGMFKTVEGFYGVSLAYPVLTSDGKLIGFVSMVFKPDALMGKIIKPYLSGLPNVEALALQTDGRIIYDKDILQIGKMTFSDPLYQSYPDLLALAKKMVQQPSGAGTYTFPASLGSAPVKKATEWTTVSLHGTEWRLIISKVAE